MDEQEGNGTTPESGSDESPPSTVFNSGSWRTSTSSPRKNSRRGIQKRVVSVPIKDVEGSRVKGENGGAATGTPPSDSWAWRKYGQKPIKGSPYPRGYYRCSSSKGCPARKQVERSHVDPARLIVTYCCEHNHPGPASRRNHNAHHHNSSATTIRKSEVLGVQPNPESDTEARFCSLGDEFLIPGDEFSWFGHMETNSSTIMESPVLAERSSVGNDEGMSMIFPMREEDESLFADLEELPECSVVFHRGGGVMERDEKGPSPFPWCGTSKTRVSTYHERGE